MSIKNQINKDCSECKQKFDISSGDLNLYEKVGLEIPQQCFYCRLKQHIAFFPFGKFRKGTSDLSGENFITVLPNKSRYPIYKSSEWWGDGWDPLSFGRAYDPDRPFFDQLKELQEKVPRPHQLGKNNVNCDWCDDAWESKNCYLTRCFLQCENVNYGYRVLWTKDSSDIVYSFKLQKSYDCLECYDSFNLNFSQNSRDCIDSYFLFDCRNCQNCFMSFNLRNKQYCIRNKQYTKEEYEKELETIRFDSYENLQKLKNEFEDILKSEGVHRENFNIRCTDSSGNYMTDCDKCVNVFSWEQSQNCRNSLRGFGSKDCIDQTVTWGSELSGNNSGVSGRSYALKYSSWTDTSRYSEYLDICVECEYCFGCIGLQKKKYCILNKKYTKEEYEKLKTQIITDMEKRGEYGKFMPYSMAPYDFNLSAGLIYFPDTPKEEILKHEGYWSDEDLSSEDGISSLDLPDSIKETEQNISSKALICPETKYRFNISASEYEFHKNKNFALPRTHFDLRILKKIRKTAVLKSFPYECFYCQKEIMAYYPPEWGYKKIACEECYKQNIA